MKRTQLYLDDDMAKTLSAVSRQRGQTVSELVRECIREKYSEQHSVDKVALARQLAGVWKLRTDILQAEEYVRGFRKDTRRKRLKID